MPIPHHGTAVSRAAHNTAMDTERKIGERIENKRKEIAGWNRRATSWRSK
jgi:hypothetical protein